MHFRPSRGITSFLASSERLATISLSTFGVVRSTFATTFANLISISSICIASGRSTNPVRASLATGTNNSASPIRGLRASSACPCGIARPKDDIFTWHAVQLLRKNGWHSTAVVDKCGCCKPKPCQHPSRKGFASSSQSHSLEQDPGTRSLGFQPMVPSRLSHHSRD